MIRSSTSRIVAAMSVLAIPAFALSASAWGQTAPATAAAPAPAPQPMAATQAAPTLPKDISTRIEAHIKSLHSQLKITAAEQPQWDAYANVMREGAARMNEAFQDRGEKLATMNAADNMDSYAQIAQTHATNMQKLSSAFQTLYGTFPDQQKQVADNVFRNSGAKHLPGKKSAAH